MRSSDVIRPRMHVSMRRSSARIVSMTRSSRQARLRTSDYSQKREVKCYRGLKTLQRGVGGESGSRAFGFSGLFGLPPRIANSCRRLHLTGNPFARRLPSFTFLCRFCRRHGTRDGTRARNLSRRRVLNPPVICEGRDAAPSATPQRGVSETAVAETSVATTKSGHFK